MTDRVWLRSFYSAKGVFCATRKCNSCTALDATFRECAEMRARASAWGKPRDEYLQSLKIEVAKNDTVDERRGK